LTTVGSVKGQPRITLSRVSVRTRTSHREAHAGGYGFESSDGSARGWPRCHAAAARRGRRRARGQGSVALSLCTNAHPLHTRFLNTFGASIFKTTMRPNPSEQRRARGARVPEGLVPDVVLEGVVQRRGVHLPPRHLQLQRTLNLERSASQCARQASSAVVL
jgi:hypothetical protein